jgi:GDPmannose 4,6-dehydratase
MSKRVALIIGATGQVGAYLARFLLKRDYVVHGTSRDAAVARLEGLSALGIREQVQLHSLSLLDVHSITTVIERVRPNEIYNLSGQSSVALSFSQPIDTFEGIWLGTLNMLDALRRMRSNIRFFNAGSSECFGDTLTSPANEQTAFNPRSPYGIAKGAAVWLVKNYREGYDLFASSGLLFNHESPLRPARFVTRKITSTAARIARGSGERLVLGDLSIQRDWGWAPEYVDAMWRMLQCDSPQDLVIASGTAHTLEEFAALAFAQVGLNWRSHVDYDASLKRPTDISCSIGDASKARDILGWSAKIGFEEIISRMVRAEREGILAVS